MPHDFIDPFSSPKTIRRDAAGASCTDANGVMDYYVTVTKWSMCSVEAFTTYYNQVISQLGSFCLPQITKVRLNLYLYTQYFWTRGKIVDYITNLKLSQRAYNTLKIFTKKL